MLKGITGWCKGVIKTYRAIKSLDRKDYDKALELANEVTELMPYNDAGVCLKAMALLYKGEPEEAIYAANTVLTHDPKDMLMVRVKSFSLCQFKLYEEVLLLCDKTKNYNSKDIATISIIEAWAWEGLKDHATALRKIEESIALKKTEYDAWYAKSVILTNMGHKEYSTYCCEHAMKLEPDNIYNTNCLGIICHNLQQYEQALQFFINTWDTCSMHNILSWLELDDAACNAYRIAILAQPFEVILKYIDQVSDIFPQVAQEFAGVPEYQGPPENHDFQQGLAGAAWFLEDNNGGAS